MNILIMSDCKSTIVKNTTILPRVGDRVEINYKPMPTVFDVVLWPNQNDLKKFNEDIDVNIDAIVMVK